MWRACFYVLDGTILRAKDNSTGFSIFSNISLQPWWCLFCGGLTKRGALAVKHPLSLWFTARFPFICCGYCWRVCEVKMNRRWISVMFLSENTYVCITGVASKRGKYYRKQQKAAEQVLETSSGFTQMWTWNTLVASARREFLFWQVAHFPFDTVTATNHKYTQSIYSIRSPHCRSRGRERFQVVWD